MATDDDWWVNGRCEVVCDWQPDMRCMRPAGHEGRHRGSRMVPETVWFTARSTEEVPQ